LGASVLSPCLDGPVRDYFEYMPPLLFFLALLPVWLLLSEVTLPKQSDLDDDSFRFLWQLPRRLAGKLEGRGTPNTQNIQ